MPYTEISDDDATDLTVSVKEAILVEGQSAIVYDADGNIVTQVVGPCDIITPAWLESTKKQLASLEDGEEGFLGDVAGFLVLGGVLLPLPGTNRWLSSG